MLKKHTAILFMTVAYAILLGHSIIPHHHHDNDQDLTEHHNSHHQTHHHHDHDGDNDSKGLSHLFSHFIHSADGFTITTNKSISNSFSKQLVSLVAVLPPDFLLVPFDIPPLFGKPPSEHFSPSFSFACTFGLRAPPAFIA